MSFLISILVGAIAGWLADLVFKRFSFSLLTQILLGIIGGLIGGWIFGNTFTTGASGILDRILTAFVGAVIILGIAALIKGSRRTV
ncbi:GlsB/YeaQ/YmgE family stress response membrane protein [Rudanella paleaurantiibacter]|uniref:GlsB/YeaQ/YmgE family stress response membrane protein n=1 Tax=Rudanella paleaurantiibacter TaxID=2614655 RepID=A0A7J5TU23_9BACT|nr:MULTISPECIES: GlsB/YeaQ/YmgE family stress response membrane protein [Rudanella]KAB7727514.1 GlsB/YeaQ/YmgE family stress response membrane protein [Rudanella paleaurantiibacter]